MSREEDFLEREHQAIYWPQMIKANREKAKALIGELAYLLDAIKEKNGGYEDLLAEMEKLIVETRTYNPYSRL